MSIGCIFAYLVSYQFTLFRRQQSSNVIQQRLKCLPLPVSTIYIRRFFTGRSTYAAEQFSGLSPPSFQRQAFLVYKLT